MGEKFQLRVGRILRARCNAREGYVNSIGRGAAHDAGNGHRSECTHAGATCAVNFSAALRILSIAAALGEEGSGCFFTD